MELVTQPKKNKVLNGDIETKHFSSQIFLIEDIFQEIAVVKKFSIPILRQLFSKRDCFWYVSFF